MSDYLGCKYSSSRFVKYFHTFISERHWQISPIWYLTLSVQSKAVFTKVSIFSLKIGEHCRFWCFHEISDPADGDHLEESTNPVSGDKKAFCR
ncbi:hypothetical protein TRIP_B200142 [uncultured Desulfatiglans sp.]|uniref:Uncharacterized protein n=1 Tax=Uncultured Desulfatiglans sp. TaxID=1748965 RepID=A0A653A2X2_UNCDX|nr:hypothetical protein TRIP_B200142 [uncultured Desulfatiglans sp.]